MKEFETSVQEKMKEELREEESEFGFAGVIILSLRVLSPKITRYVGYQFFSYKNGPIQAYK
jgi:hypothetical protein